MAVHTIIGLQAAEYARAGWALVRLPPRSKGAEGMRKDWNTQRNAVTNPELIARWHGNVGLALAFSGVASIDIDDVAAAGEWLHHHGIDLDALRAAPDAVHVLSGVTGRDKLFYRLPDGFDAPSLVTHRIARADRKVALELRCAGQDRVTMQDVLPPSVHPVTGKPYQWGGDWRKLPLIPPALLALWLSLQRAHAPRTHAQPLGDGTGAAMADMFTRLDSAGCKPFWAGHSIRAHCPVHIGESGTTLKVDEAADGRLLVHCHAGTCTFTEILDALGLGPVEWPHAKTPESAPERDDPPPATAPLPDLPASLCALPGRLGDVQAWIAATMYRPHVGVAGLVTLALVDFMAMDRTRIASRGGLAMGEFFLVLAPSAFGKESLRTPFRLLHRLAARDRLMVPDLVFSAPSSQQGLQELLVASRCVAMLPDEFGDWIAKGDKDHHREQAMAHLMQVYGNPFGTVDVPRAVSRKLPPVHEPRMLLFGTSTAERFSEVMNGSIADRGFLNRFVILPLGNDTLEIADELDSRAAYEIPAALASLAKALSGSACEVTFDDDALDYRNVHLRAELDPLALRDNRLAGRLNEQAIRMAAALTLGTGRTTIGVRDMAMGYEIRQALYARTAAMFEMEAVLTSDNPQMRAHAQARAVLKKHGSLTIGRLRVFARQFRVLKLREQNEVLHALIAEGLVRKDGDRFHSLETE